MDIQELANAYAKGRLSAIIEKVIAEIYILMAITQDTKPSLMKLMK